VADAPDVVAGTSVVSPLLPTSALTDTPEFGAGEEASGAATALVASEGATGAAAGAGGAEAGAGCGSVALHKVEKKKKKKGKGGLKKGGGGAR